MSLCSMLGCFWERQEHFLVFLQLRFGLALIHQSPHRKDISQSPKLLRFKVAHHTRACCIHCDRREDHSTPDQMSPDLF